MWRVSGLPYWRETTHTNASPCTTRCFSRCDGAALPAINEVETIQSDAVPGLIGQRSMPVHDFLSRWYNSRRKLQDFWLFNQGDEKSAR
jgi:hypothetical protein